MKAFGYLNLFAGVFIAVLTLSHALRTMDLIAFTFIAGTVITIPSLATYTKLGLNEDGGEYVEESKRRSKLLKSTYPYILAPFIFVAVLYLAIAFWIKDYRIFLLFSSYVCLASGYWALWVYPRALELFEPLKPYTKTSNK